MKSFSHTIRVPMQIVSIEAAEFGPRGDVLKRRLCLAPQLIDKPTVPCTQTAHLGPHTRILSITVSAVDSEGIEVGTYLAVTLSALTDDEVAATQVQLQDHFPPLGPLVQFDPAEAEKRDRERTISLARETAVVMIEEMKKRLGGWWK